MSHGCRRKRGVRLPDLSPTGGLRRAADGGDRHSRLVVQEYQQFNKQRSSGAVQVTNVGAGGGAERGSKPRHVWGAERRGA